MKSKFIDQLNTEIQRRKATPHPVDFVILPNWGVLPVQIRRSVFVQDDWCAWLPQEKAQVFNEQVQQLESVYMMFSIALNEAIEFRRTGMLSKSYQAVCMTPALAGRLSSNLARTASRPRRARKTLRNNSQCRSAGSRELPRTEGTTHGQNE